VFEYQAAGEDLLETDWRAAPESRDRQGVGGLQAERNFDCCSGGGDAYALGDVQCPRTSLC